MRLIDQICSSFPNSSEVLLACKEQRRVLFLAHIVFDLGIGSIEGQNLGLTVGFPRVQIYCAISMKTKQSNMHFPMVLPEKTITKFSIMVI